MKLHNLPAKLIRTYDPTRVQAKKAAALKRMGTSVGRPDGKGCAINLRKA
jgi:hypothetical protein